MAKSLTGTNQSEDEQMKVTYKGYRPIDQLIIEKLFTSETINSYENSGRRWYVFEYSPGHYIHYTFYYNQWSVNIRFIVSPQTNIESNPLTTQ